MEKSLKTQLDIKQNAEELQKYLTELHTWEKEMKVKEKILTGAVTEQQNIPPPRNIGKKRTNDSDGKKPEEKKRISGFDYRGWDKFNAEEACQEAEQNESTEKSVDSVTTVNEQGQIKRASKEDLSKEKMKKIDEAFFEKEQGNKFVRKEKWSEAMQCYSRAIDLDPENAIYHANRALCHLKLAKFKAAEVDSTVAIQLDPTYIKAYQRRAFARKALQQYEEATADFQKVIEIEPTNVQAKAEIDKIGQLTSSSSKSSKLTFNPKNMFGHKNEDVVKQKIGKQKNPAKETSSAELKQNSLQKTAIIQECSLAEEEKTNIVEQPVKSTSVFLSEIPPDWKEVKPVSKPSHLRSKNPLKKIPVLEVALSQMPKSLTVKTGAPSSEEVAENKPRKEHTKTGLPQSPVKKQADRLPFDLKKKQKASHDSVTSEVPIPAIPQTCVQFQNSWKQVKHERNLAYAFLKQLQLDRLPRLFGSSLESELLSELLNSLSSAPFLEDAQFVYDFLLQLTRVERFKSLVLFMSDDDQRGVRQCLEKLESTGSFNIEDLKSLRANYDLG